MIERTTFRFVFTCANMEGQFCWSAAFWEWSEALRHWRQHVQTVHVSTCDPLFNPLVSIEELTRRQLLW